MTLPAGADLSDEELAVLLAIGRRQGRLPLSCHSLVESLIFKGYVLRTAEGPALTSKGKRADKLRRP